MLSDDKPDGTSWSEYLRALYSGAEISTPMNPNAPDYDDIVQACRAAIKEELPVEEMNR